MEVRGRGSRAERSSSERLTRPAGSDSRSQLLRSAPLSIAPSGRSTESAGTRRLPPPSRVLPRGDEASVRSAPGRRRGAQERAFRPEQRAPDTDPICEEHVGDRQGEGEGKLGTWRAARVEAQRVTQIARPSRSGLLRPTQPHLGRMQPLCPTSESTTEPQREVRCTSHQTVATGRPRAVRPLPASGGPCTRRSAPHSSRRQGQERCAPPSI